MSKGVSGRVGWEEISSGESLEGGIYGSSNRGNPKIQELKKCSSSYRKKCILLYASVSLGNYVGLDFRSSMAKKIKAKLYLLVHK